METLSYSKRKRCADDDSPHIVVQRKVHLNERMFASRDTEKIKKIQQKTLDMLFQAARNPHQATKEQDGTHQQSIAARIMLTGNGEVHVRDFLNNNKDKLNTERTEAKCCQRPTLFQLDCSSCRLPLCENCGYSCSDCGAFLCGNCVAVFNCGTVDRPVCENCVFYR